MTDVIIRYNSIDPCRDHHFSGIERVGDFLYEHFKSWPKTAVLYQDNVSVASEIPVYSEADVEALNELQGTIYIVVYPASFMAAIGIALIAATVYIQIEANKSKSTSSQKQREIPEGSPNNQLSARTNRERLEERVPDIYGKVRAFPDLLTKPYRVFEENKEVEYGYFAVGRGEYAISDIRDGKSEISNLANNSIEIYGPNTSPNFGSVQTRIGNEITEAFLVVSESNGVKGQEFIAPNKQEGYNSNVKTVYYDTREFSDGTSKSDPTEPVKRFYNDNSEQSLSSFWSANDPFELKSILDHPELREITGYRTTGSTRYANYDFVRRYILSTDYTVESVNATEIFLINPENSFNASQYDDMQSRIDEGDFGLSQYPTPKDDAKEAANIGKTIITPGSYEPGISLKTLSTGPFAFKNIDTFICNFVAQRGLYQDDGTTQTALSVDLKVTIQEIGPGGEPLGDATNQTITITGSADERKRIAETHRFATGSVGDWEITVQRSNDFDDTFDGETQDTLKWESLYGTKPITDNEFGNITTVRTRTVSSEETLAIKDRKLNMLASRKIKQRLSANLGFTSGNEETSRFPDIAHAICLDSKIGNRTTDEIDEDSFYQAYEDVINEFGTSKAGEFNHTFDDSNLSFEEIISIVAEACYCTVYRQGQKIKFHFEKSTPTSSLLFNHRNKIPNSEARTVNFGRLNEHDGVQIDWIDTDDGATQTIHLPSDQSAINPEKMKILGITHKLQAYFHAHRNWNRIQYQNTVVEFDATQEAALLKINERIRIADNTRSNTFDGEVVSQNSLTLKLSQPFTFEDGKSYTIFLQNTDGTVEGIGISAGNFMDEVVLDTAPSTPLALANDLYARTTYEIIENASNRSQAFLVQEKRPEDNFTFGIQAVNYDERYYQNDTDFIDGVVDADGNTI